MTLSSEPFADRLEAIERRLAYSEQVADDLSDIVIRQGVEIDRLTRICERLRGKILEMESGWSPSPQDERPPPHY